MTADHRLSTRAGRPGVGFGANINRTDRTGANRRFVHSIKSPGWVERGRSAFSCLEALAAFSRYQFDVWRLGAYYVNAVVQCIQRPVLKRTWIVVIRKCGFRQKIKKG